MASNLGCSGTQRISYAGHISLAVRLRNPDPVERSVEDQRVLLQVSTGSATSTNGGIILLTRFGRLVPWSYRWGSVLVSLCEWIPVYPQVRLDNIAHAKPHAGLADDIPSQRLRNHVCESISALSTTRNLPYSVNSSLNAVARGTLQRS